VNKTLHYLHLSSELVQGLFKRNGKIFSFGTPRQGGAGGSQKLKIGIRIFLKKSSNFVQKAPQKFKVAVFRVDSLGHLRLGCAICQDFPSVFEIFKTHGNMFVDTN
jgi:hypothetical protein